MGFLDSLKKTVQLLLGERSGKKRRKPLKAKPRRPAAQKKNPRRKTKQIIKPKGKSKTKVKTKIKTKTKTKVKVKTKAVSKSKSKAKSKIGQKAGNSQKSPKRKQTTSPRKSSDISKKKTARKKTARKIAKPVSLRKKSAVSKTPSKKLSAKKLPNTSKSKTAKQSLTREVMIGEVTHYFNKISVCVVKITRNKLTVGDRIRIHTGGEGFIQPVKSLQVESRDVRSARKGQLVGLKVKQKARPGDKVSILG